MTKTSNGTILVIGESCIDEFIYCQVKRLSPEAPVPILNPVEKKMNLGMAANVKANLKSLLAERYDVTLMAQTCHEIKKTRYSDIDSGYIIVRIDEGDVIEPFHEFNQADFLNEVSYLQKNGGLKAIVISDYCKGYLSYSDIEFIALWAKENSIPSFLDTKKKITSSFSSISFIKINEKEFAASGNERCLNELNGFTNLIVTRGSRPTFDYFYKYNNFLEQSHYNLRFNEFDSSDVISVAGAGDVFLAAFVANILSLTNNYSDFNKIVSADLDSFITQSIKYANAACKYAVSKRGVTVVKQTDIKL